MKRRASVERLRSSSPSFISNEGIMMLATVVIIIVWVRGVDNNSEWNAA